MAFDVQGALKAGYSSAEVADYLASQKNFDVAGARSAGYSDDEIITHLSAGKAGFLENVKDIGTAVIEGAAQTYRSGRAAVSTYLGADEDVVEQARKSSEAQRTSEADALKALKQDIQTRKEAADEGIVQGIKNVAGAVANNPAGGVQLVAEQAPNAAVALGTAALGAKGGAAIGTALLPGVGTAGGAVIGGVAGFLAGLFGANTLLETGGKAIEKAGSGSFTPEDRSQVIKEGTTKGAVITAVDAATLGASKFILGAAGRAVEDATVRALTDAGIDATKAASNIRAAQQAAIQSTAGAGEKATAEAVQKATTEAMAREGLLDPAISSAVQAAQKAAFETAATLPKRLGRGAAVVGMESVGEGLGEGLGEYAATGTFSPTEAVLESVAGLAQSIPEIYVAKKLNQPGILTDAMSRQRQAVAQQNLNAAKDASGAAAAANELAGSVDELTGSIDQYLRGGNQTTNGYDRAQNSLPNQQRTIDREAELLAQANQAGTQFDRQMALDQIGTLRPEAKQGASAGFVDLTPMDSLQAKQRLAILRDEAARSNGNALGLQIVSHPSQSGRFAIIEQQLPSLDLPSNQTPISTQEAQARIESAALAGAEQQRRAEDSPRQQMISRTMANIEARGGVASPMEAEILRQANMGQPFDRIDPNLAPALTPDEQLTQSTGILLERAPRESQRLAASEQATAAVPLEQPASNLADRTQAVRQTLPGQMEAAGTPSITQSAPRPTRINGRPASSFTDEQLTAIVSNNSIPAITRRGAATELAARSAPAAPTETDAIAQRLTERVAQPITGRVITATAAEGTTQNKAVGSTLTVSDGGTQHNVTVQAPGALGVQGRLLNQIARIFGKRLVVFGSDTLKADGFVLPNDNQSIFIRSDSQISPLAVFGHELTHLLKRDNPQAYAALQAVVEREMGEGAMAQFTQEYGQGANVEELTSDLVGNRFQEADFWQSVFDEISAQNTEGARDIIIRMAAAITKAVNAFMRLVRQPGFQADSYIKDVNAIKKAVRTALAQYAQTQKGAALQLEAEQMQAEAGVDLAAGSKAEPAVANETKTVTNVTNAATPAANDTEREFGLDRLRMGRAVTPSPERVGYNVSETNLGADNARQDDTARAGGIPADAGQNGSELGGNGRGEIPSYGQAREGAVSVVGRHYSPAQRQSLDGNYYGRGMRGAEARRLDQSFDPRLRQRIYFYVDQGSGIQPESGVGAYAHEVRLDNIYDPDSGIIPPQPDSNSFESAVLNAGFDGYVVPFGNQKAAVLLGPKHAAVPVVPLSGVSGAPQFSPRRSSASTENRMAVVVGAKPGEFNWNFTRADLTPPPFSAPTQNGPRLEKVGEGVYEILRSTSFKKLIEDAFGITGLRVAPLHGSWLNKPEPSFAIYADGLTFEQADDLSRMLGFAFAQDATVVFQPTSEESPGDIPAVYIGSNKKLTAAQMKAVLSSAQAEGLDYSSTPDGKAIRFLHFGDEAGLAELMQKTSRIADKAGLGAPKTLYVRSQLNESKIYTEGAAGSAGQAVWFGGGEAGRSDLFRRTIDHVLVPYAKVVGGEGYRFSISRFAERFKLSAEQQGLIRQALLPKNGALKSTVDIASGKSKLDAQSTGARGKVSVSDILWALQNRSAQAGLIEPGDYSDQARKLIAEAIAEEVLYHISDTSTGKSAIGWYDRALKAAKENYAAIFPEIKTDRDRELLFDAVLGIASQGSDVFSNSLFAARVYQLVTREKMTLGQAVQALKGSFGGETVAIENNLLKLEELLDRNGYDAMRTFFNKKDTVSNINARLRSDVTLFYKNKPLSVDGAAEQMVTGWMVFGPKIGSFINNLHGDYSTLTADLWFSRTWNRILGFSFVHAPAREAEQYQTFVSTLLAEYAYGKNREGPIQPKSMSNSGKVEMPQFGTDLADLTDGEIEQILADPDEALRYATELEAAYRKGGYKIKSDLRRAAKNWIENRTDPVAHPRTDRERDFQQRTVETAQKIIKRRTGKDITIADIQASLWYYEKDDLFKQLGGTNKKSEAADYAGAAEETIKAYVGGDLFYAKTDSRYVFGGKDSYSKGVPAKVSATRQAQDIPRDGLAGRKVRIPVMIEETGQTATMTLDAKDALDDVDAREDTMQKLLECLRK